jgi:Na+-driven multidrug efflux pump
MLLVSQRALVAIEKTLAIGIITITQVIVSGLFSYWLSVHMGVSGVALGTTIGTFIATTLSSLAVLKCLNRLLQESKVK